MVIDSSLLLPAAGIIVGAAGRELIKFTLENVFMKKKSENGSSNGNGNGRLQLRGDVKEVFTDTLKMDILPVLNKQTEILISLANTNSAIERGIGELIILGKLQRGRR